MSISSWATLPIKFSSHPHRHIDIFQKQSDHVQDILKRINSSKTGSLKFLQIQYFLLLHITLFIYTEESKKELLNSYCWHQLYQLHGILVSTVFEKYLNLKKKILSKINITFLFMVVESVKYFFLLFLKLSEEIQQLVFRDIYYHKTN